MSDLDSFTAQDIQEAERRGAERALLSVRAMCESRLEVHKNQFPVDATYRAVIAGLNGMIDALKDTQPAPHERLYTEAEVRDAFITAATAYGGDVLQEEWNEYLESLKKTPRPL
jgi:hypothetical protein